LVGGNPQPLPATGPASGSSGGLGCSLGWSPRGPSGRDLLALLMLLAGLACLRARRSS
jgi:hypothetical protein